MADPRLVKTVVMDGKWNGREGVRGPRDRRCRLGWFDPPFLPPLAETTQALGVCFTRDRRIVLVTPDRRDWNLPGGTLEPGESLAQALAREAAEEACARVRSTKYIGCQRVAELDGDSDPYYQARFWARVELDDFTHAHKAGRRLVAPEDFRAALFWGREETAGLILDAALAIESSER